MDSSDSSSFGGKDGCAACCPHRLFTRCKYIWNYKCEVFVNVITAKCVWQVWLNTAQQPLSLSLQLNEWIWNRQYDGLVRFFEFWGQRWLCCLLHPSFPQKLQVHLNLKSTNYFAVCFDSLIAVLKTGCVRVFKTVTVSIHNDLCILQHRFVCKQTSTQKLQLPAHNTPTVSIITFLIVTYSSFRHAPNTTPSAHSTSDVRYIFHATLPHTGQHQYS